MDKYLNKYRIQSHRKPNFNYNANAIYFLTVVTQKRKCNLGTIKNNKMEFSPFGEIVNIEFLKSFEIRTELYLHQYIIMPNHFHCLLEIFDDGAHLDLENHLNSADEFSVQTHGRALQNQSPPNQSPPNQSHQSLIIKRNPPIRLPKSISSFMAGFKSAVNNKIDNYIDDNKLNIPKYNRNNHFFQPNYHDHIIRNETEYYRIKNYIINNPKKWKLDTFSKK